MPSFDYWAVVPAAGVGKRMGAGIPKQYLTLHDVPVIEHTIGRLLTHAQIMGVTVVVNQDDDWWTSVPSHSRTNRALGGKERCHSVLNGLESLLEQGAKTNDRVLVHDAVRPCVRGDDIDRLIEVTADYEGGGLLGVPVRDTMKRIDADNCIEATVSREQLWHALTPQMFPLGVLCGALQAAIKLARLVTDEAQAMELAGYRPRMVEGRPDNIKITRKDDMGLAELYLTLQERECE